MQFSKLASLLAALVSAAQASNVVTFQSLDDVDRTIYFTPNAGLKWLDSVKVPAGEDVDVNFPDGWVGNFNAVHSGKSNAPGMLGEVAFNGWNGLNYYDVSAIVNPHDIDNISELFPYHDPGKPVSGCGGRAGFPCNNAYYAPNDVQTKVTQQSHLVCTLGKNGVVGRSKRAVDADEDESPSVKRDFVLGKF